MTYIKFQELKNNNDSRVIDRRSIDAGEVSRFAPNLVYMVYTDEIKIEREHVVAFNDLVDEWYKDGESAYFLINITGKYNDFTRQAQDYLAKEAPILEKGKVKATAVVINNLAGRILIKFFISIFKPKYPTQFFETEEKAYEWLRKKGLIDQIN
ncbi:DUF7793 family protein [Crocinitomix algicola]|uniref:DUF7793 family protein n=1 Tax=Crocinitomix algicola TaxID=1740263 RepID=UPI00087326E3|nr:STAS/SEC14 domain-containing protein [Crocinitomix algicola]